MIQGRSLDDADDPALLYYSFNNIQEKTRCLEEVAAFCTPCVLSVDGFGMKGIWRRFGHFRSFRSPKREGYPVKIRFFTIYGSQKCLLLDRISVSSHNMLQQRSRRERRPVNNARGNWCGIWHASSLQATKLSPCIFIY